MYMVSSQQKALPKSKFLPSYTHTRRTPLPCQRLQPRLQSLSSLPVLSLRSADTASDRPRAHPKNCARAVGVIVSVQEGGIAPASEGGFRSFGRSWISQTPSKEAISCGRGQLAGAMLQRPFLAPQRKLLPVFKFLARGSLCARLLTVLAVALSHLSSVCLWIRVSFLILASGFSP